MEPIQTHSLCGPGQYELNILLFGKEGGRPFNWSSKVLRDRDLERAEPLRTQAILETISRYACERGVETVYAPSVVKFNGAVAPGNKLTKRAHHITKTPQCIFHGEYVDGVVCTYDNRAGVYISSADCPTIVMVGRSRWGVGHGGRDSLLPINGKSVASIVDALFDQVVEHTEDRRGVMVGVYLGIAPQHFEHPITDPTYGEHNTRMINFIDGHYGRQCFHGPPEDGRLNLFEIIRMQCGKLRIPHSNVLGHTEIDTFSDPRFWSARAGDQGRNGVFVLPQAP